MPDNEPNSRDVFRNPMDPASIRQRLRHGEDDEIYQLAVRAAGHQSDFTVDKLSYALKSALPALISGFAAEIEAQNKEERRARELGRL